ncbi:MAG TPA: SdpI family protein [Rhizomicrobium sp.]|jgi:uncharacterized membrane protein|nr:SdpI family protein [Rhizomicrobium sp.]
MSLRFPLIVSLLLIAAMLAGAAHAWSLLPPNAVLATHWDASGHVNGHMPKTLALFIAPLMGLGMMGLFALLPYIDPRGRNLLESGKFYVAGWLGAIALLATAQAGIVATAFHLPVDMRSIVLAATALLLIVLGNYAGKVRANFFAGFRTPWTLSSDYAWEHTNRLGGKLFMLTGTATIAALLVFDSRVAVFVMTMGVLLAALIPAGMSYVYWRRDPERTAAP